MKTIGRRGVLAGILGGIVLAGGAGLGFVYFGVMGGSSVARLTLSSPASAGTSTSATSSAAASASASAGTGTGTWTVASGSVAGYRVREQLAFAAAPSDAVGRTSSIQGTISIQGSAGVYQVSAASFTVDVSTLTSDRAMRDQRIHTMGLESSRYPTATFTLSSPIALPAAAETGQAVDVQATGNLTIHGVTRTVTIPLQARLSGSKIEVAGSITFPFSDFGMTPPSIGGFVTVQPNATMEFDVFFQQ
jgi:polyisoprenoid-binding protein YceI